MKARPAMIGIKVITRRGKVGNIVEMSGDKVKVLIDGKFIWFNVSSLREFRIR